MNKFFFFSRFVFRAPEQYCLPFLSRLLGRSSKCILGIPFRKLQLHDLQIPAHYTSVIYIGFWIECRRLSCRFVRIRFVLVPPSFRWKPRFVLRGHTAFPFAVHQCDVSIRPHQPRHAFSPLTVRQIPRNTSITTFLTRKAYSLDITRSPVINYNSIRQPMETRWFIDGTVCGGRRRHALNTELCRPDGGRKRAIDRFRTKDEGRGTRSM